MTVIACRWVWVIDIDHLLYCSFCIMPRTKFIWHVIAKQLQATPSSSKDRCVTAYCPLLCMNLCMRRMYVHNSRTNPAKISAFRPNAIHKKVHPTNPMFKIVKSLFWTHSTIFSDYRRCACDEQKDIDQSGIWTHALSDQRIGRTLSWRLRPLGHLAWWCKGLNS
jgi:hypothetical protein